MCIKTERVPSYTAYWLAFGKLATGGQYVPGSAVELGKPAFRNMTAHVAELRVRASQCRRGGGPTSSVSECSERRLGYFAVQTHFCQFRFRKPGVPVGNPYDATN